MLTTGKNRHADSIWDFFNFADCLFELRVCAGSIDDSDRISGFLFVSEWLFNYLATQDNVESSKERVFPEPVGLWIRAFSLLFRHLMISS